MKKVKYLLFINKYFLIFASLNNLQNEYKTNSQCS